ncbi:MAG: PDZ domain-containing protein [Acidobacteriota bacterium]
MIELLTEVGKAYFREGSASFWIMYLLAVVLVLWQYRRMQQLTSGPSTSPAGLFLRPTIISALAGLVAGYVGSILLVVCGIDLGGSNFLLVFLLALCLMLIHPRFICFAYAGGILSITNILFGFPHLKVAQVMGLVAILHIVESILILLTGHLDPMPVYSERPGVGTVGGFNLQKFWPIPLIALTAAGPVSGPMSHLGWWPLINYDYSHFAHLADYLWPVLAILGYGEVTTTSTPRQRTRASAFYLAIFSIMLLALSIWASYHPAFLIVPALFGPVGHEIVIRLGIKAESSQTPIYMQTTGGVMVLDVIKGSPAEQAGLQSRDLILSMNGVKVDSRIDVEQELLNLGWGETLTLVFIRDDQRRVISLLPGPRHNLGIVSVPEIYSPLHYELRTSRPFATILLKIKRFIG